MKGRTDYSFNTFKNLCCLVLVLVCEKGFSGPADSLKFKIGVLPSAFYSPETRLGMGGVIYSHFRLKKNDSVTKRTSTQSYLSYTQNKQFSIENDYQIWAQKNALYFSGSFDYKIFPELFYGIGNDTKEQENIMMSYHAIRIQSKNFYRLMPFTYAGLVFNYRHIYNQDIALKSTPSMELYGTMGFEAKGVGAALMIDDRDNQLNPGKGMFAEVVYMDYKNMIDNKNMFTSLTIDVRKYFTLWDKLIWNGNIYFASNRGEVPYLMLAELGGARFLRGYYRGRFRDNNMIVIQQEFRMPVYKIIGVAVFGGFGNVSKSLPELRTNQMHYSYGLGLRIKVNKKENTNVRIDYGITKDSQGIYVVFAEAF